MNADLEERTVLARRSHFADDRRLIEPAERFLDARWGEAKEEASRGLRIEEKLESSIGSGSGLDEEGFSGLRVLTVGSAPKTPREKLDRSR